MSLAWTIAGFSPCASVGVVADCRTFSALQVESFAITTTLTAQNGLEVSEVMPVPLHLFKAQFNALKKLGWPKVIKIGLIPNSEILDCMLSLLQDYQGNIIYDPVIKASTGQVLMEPNTLQDIIEHLLPKVTLITPNIYEAEKLTKIAIHSHEDRVKTARKLCQFGVNEVIIKGGHFPGTDVHDFWTDGKSQRWLSLPRLTTSQTHGTGCTFSSALAAFIALGYEALDAIVLAKMTIHESIETGFKPTTALNFVRVKAWPSKKESLPSLYSVMQKTLPFAQCDALGFYPIVDSVMWIKKLINWGVTSIQLRIKNHPADLHEQISQACQLCAKNRVQLFINDEWELAIKYGAYGVHLGQEDLNKCDLTRLQKSGLRLGISTHSYSELAWAMSVQPSYIALGPIFQTYSKPMRFAPQGFTVLRRWRELVSCPLVAIGGITLENVSAVLSCGVDGISVISALTQAKEPQAICQQFLKLIQI